MLSFLCAVAVHEGGHLLAAILCGVPVRRLRVGLLGFRLSMAYDAVSYGRELCVLLAGSVAGLLAAAAPRNVSGTMPGHQSALCKLQ